MRRNFVFTSKKLVNEKLVIKSLYIQIKIKEIWLNKFFGFNELCDFQGL